MSSLFNLKGYDSVFGVGIMYSLSFGFEAKEGALKCDFGDGIFLDKKVE